MSGADMDPASSNVQRMRMLFVIEVTELGPTPFGKDSEYGSQGLAVNSVPINLDLGNSRRHVWSSEEDFKEFVNSGLYPMEERAQYRMMLEAFVFHKQDLAYLHTVNRQSQRPTSS